jgi:hypothetical protein
MGWFTGIACLFWGVLLTARANYANGKNNVPRLKLSYKGKASLLFYLAIFVMPPSFFPSTPNANHQSFSLT